MDGLTIQEVETITGLTGHTLRYYEKADLMIGAVERAANGHRRYSQDDVSWLRFLTRLRETGMAICDIRRYAELARQGDATRRDRFELLESHRRKVQAQLLKTQDHLTQIENKIAHYRDLFPVELGSTAEALPSYV